MIRTLQARLANLLDTFFSSSPVLYLCIDILFNFFRYRLHHSPKPCTETMEGTHSNSFRFLHSQSRYVYGVVTLFIPSFINCVWVINLYYRSLQSRPLLFIYSLLISLCFIICQN